MYILSYYCEGLCVASTVYSRAVDKLIRSCGEGRIRHSPSPPLARTDGVGISMNARECCAEWKPSQSVQQLSRCSIPLDQSCEVFGLQLPSNSMLLRTQQIDSIPATIICTVHMYLCMYSMYVRMYVCTHIHTHIRK